MKNILRAVAVSLMFASGAQAATLDGPTVTPHPTLSNWFVFKTGNTLYEPGDPFNVYTLELKVSDSTRTETFSFLNDIDPADDAFAFRWLNGLVKNFTIKAVLTSYTNSYIDRTFTAGSETWRLYQNGLFKQRTETFEISAAALKAAPTAMPIGGTLPLMLSALGLGALVMRRRAKRAAA